MTDLGTAGEVNETVSDNLTEVKSFDGVMNSAYGQKLEKPISFKGTYVHLNVNSKFEKEELPFDTPDGSAEIPGKERLTIGDYYSVINEARKANARQKAMQDALDAAKIEKPTLENNPDMQLKNMVKSLVASKKYTEEQATVFAKTALGID